MKTIYKLGILFLIILSIAVFYLYNKHVRYVDRLVLESNFLLEDYNRFCGNYYDCIPRTDINVMLEWIESVSGYSMEERYQFIKDGYGIKYDSVTGQSILYSFGKNGKDDLLKNTPFNGKNTNEYGQYPIYTRGFLAFLWSFFDENDIILANFYPHQYDCDFYTTLKDQRHLNKRFEIYRGSKSLLKTEYEKEVRLFLKTFSEDYFKGDWEKSPNSFKTTLLMYSNGSIKFVCDAGLSNDYKTNIIKELEGFFKNFNKSDFDYSLFYLYVPDGVSKTNR